MPIWGTGSTPTRFSGVAAWRELPGELQQKVLDQLDVGDYCALQRCPGLHHALPEPEGVRRKLAAAGVRPAPGTSVADMLRRLRLESPIAARCSLAPDGVALAPRTYNVTTLAISHDERYVLSLAEKRLHVWAMAASSLRGQPYGDGPTHVAAWFTTLPAGLGLVSVAETPTYGLRMSVHDVSQALPGPVVKQGEISPLAAHALAPLGRYFIGRTYETPMTTRLVDTHADALPFDELAGAAGLAWRQAVFSADGILLVLLTSGEMARLWRLDAPSVACGVLGEATRNGTAAAFSPQGERLALAMASGIIKIFDVADLDAPPIDVLGHEQTVPQWLSFLPDGRHLLWGQGTDLWAEVEGIRPVAGHEADASWLAATGNPDVAGLWVAGPGALLARALPASRERRAAPRCALWRTDGDPARSVTATFALRDIKAAALSPSRTWLATNGHAGVRVQRLAAAPAPPASGLALLGLAAGVAVARRRAIVPPASGSLNAGPVPAIPGDALATLATPLVVGLTATGCVLFFVAMPWLAVTCLALAALAGVARGMSQARQA